MAKQNINVGITANDKKGDSLRAAFVKVNNNFTELYTALGLNADISLNLGAFEFTGSVMTTNDSSNMTIGESGTVINIAGDLVPSVANGSDLGSPSKPWNSLYVSTSTIYLGGVPLSLDADNNLLINNSPISSAINYASIPGAPTDISDLTDDGELLGGGGASVTESDNPPIDPAAGDLWYDTVGGRMYVYYDNSWVDANPSISNSTNELVNGDSSFSVSSDGTLTLTHPDEPNYHPLSTTLTIQKAAGNYHTISGAYGLSLQATPVPSGYGLDTNTNFVDIFHDGVSVNVNDNTWTFGTDGALTLPPTNIITAALSQQVGTIITDIEAWNWHNGTGNPYTWNQWNPEFLSLYNIGDSIIGWSFYSDADPSNVVTITARNPDISELTFSGDLGSPPYVAHSPDYVSFHGNPVVIQTQGPQFQANWSFGTDGTTTFPTGGQIANYPDGVGASDNSWFVTPGGEDGNGGVSSQDGQQYIQINNNLSVEIGTSYGTANESIWRFGRDGNLTFPQGTLLGYSDPGGFIIDGAVDKDIAIYTYSGADAHGWTFGTDGSLTIPGDIRSEGNINIDINLADSTLRRWQFGEDGSLTLPSVGKISNGAYDWTFGSTGITTFPGVINAGNINNLVVNDLGGGTSQTAGSQVQIGNSAGIAGAGVIIKNAVTNTLSGEFSSTLESGSKIQMDNGIVSLSSYTYNSIGDDTGLENQLVVEVDNNYLNNVVRIGTRTITTTGGSTINSFQGITINQYGNITFPDATVQTTAYNPSNIRSEGNINIEINLSDSTLRRWQFGEDGGLTLPSVGKINNGAYDWTFGTDGRTTFPNGTVPEHSYGAAGDKEGMVVFTDPYIYYCKQDYVDDLTDIWVRVAWTGTNW